MPRFRGHHLVCLHFFGGEGYNAAFVKNLQNILNRVENDDIVICGGADDICIKCPHLKDDRCQRDEGADEDIKKMDEKALSLLHVGPGVRVKWKKMRGRLPEIFHEWSESFCAGCDWKWACEKNKFYRQLKGKQRNL